MNTIYIDGLGLVDGHFSGVGQYILGILRGLDDILESQNSTSAVLAIKVVIPRDKVKRFKSFGFKRIQYKKFPLPFRYMASLWSRGMLPPIDLWCGLGSYVFPRFVDMPLLFHKPDALVIFDLSFELYRQYSDEGNARFLSKGVRESLKRTKNVIAISENAKNEICEFYGLSKSVVKVATPAVDRSVFYRRSQNEIDKIKLKYGISGNYILALSNLEPRKNLEMLVDAYCALPKRLRDTTGLLLVGVSGWKIEELFAKIVEKVGQGYNIIRPSKYVADSDKAAIISGASMLVYPSHYEGFGMPPLEALACGVPVICADNSSLPEVVGDAAKLIDSKDKDGLVTAIVEYLDNIQAITEISKLKGPEQADKFTWTESAQVFLDTVMDKTK
jgi:alpha-1,3-rhamnosyl/mannosyltransferase